MSNSTPKQRLSHGLLEIGGFAAFGDQDCAGQLPHLFGQVETMSSPWPSSTRSTWTSGTATSLPSSRRDGRPVGQWLRAWSRRDARAPESPGCGAG
jgi:hypothetical protein